MRVCVIADEENMRARVRQALGAGQGCEAGQMIRVDQAEAHLAQNKHDVVLVATGRASGQDVELISRLRDMSTGHLLAIGPVSDPRLVLGILRGGAIDYVDEATLEAELPPALERLKFGRGSRMNPGRLIAVLSPSGGCGASMLTANLAVALARTQERCLAVDLKSRSGDLAAMFDVRPSHTLQDLCRLAGRIDRVLLEQTLSKLPNGVGLLASPRSFDTTISAEAISRVFDLGRSLYPRIIADCDPTLPEETVEALRLADSILMVLRLEFNALRNAKALLDQLERLRIDSRKVSLVANRVGQAKEIPAAKVEEALNRKFFAKLPDDPKAALGSQNNGVPVLIEYPSSRLSKTLVAMAASINTLVPAEQKGS